MSLYGIRILKSWAYLYEKPNIYLLAKVEGAGQATYFRIPWTEENMYKIKKMQDAIARQGSAQGQFKKSWISRALK